MPVLKILMLICALAMLNIPVSAGAQTTAPDPDELRKLAYAHEFQTLETLLEQLQEDVLAERLTYTDQRRAYRTLSRLHLDMIEAVNLWHSQMPDSIHAQALRARMMYYLGWRMRGEEAAWATYPDALSGMLQLHNEGMQIAMAVFNEHPDFIPVSDVVMLLERTARFEHSVRDMASEDTPFIRIMRLTPNRETLMFYFMGKLPQWGGHFGQVIEACDVYASRLKDVEDYTSEICQVDTIYTLNYKAPKRSGSVGPDKYLKWAQDALDRNDHPILAAARLIDAGRDRPDREGAQALLLNDIESLPYRSIYDAIQYDATNQASLNRPKIAPRIFAVLHKQVLRELEHDPYNPKLLDVAMLRELDGVSPEVEPDWPTLAEYKRRKLMFAPYNHRYWGEYSGVFEAAVYLEEHHGVAAEDQVSAYYRNAVVYSNYMANSLASYRDYLHARLLGEMKINGAGLGRMDGEYRDPASFAQPELAQQNKQIICPFIAAHRLLGAVCDADENNYSCTGSFIGKSSIERIFEIADERAACEKELTAPVQDLLYAPEEFDWQNPTLQ